MKKKKHEHNDECDTGCFLLVEELLIVLIEKEIIMAKTVADLDASLGNLATALTALATAVDSSGTAPDMTSEVSSVDNATAQVQALTAKLTPPAPPAAQ